jgi:hypothetical protein
LGHEGFLVGAEAGYDVQKAAITRYSAAIGYSAPAYTAAITATNSLSVFSASYYQQVNSQTEVGAKATWDSKAGSNVGLELASKYVLDPSSFAKVSIIPSKIAILVLITFLHRPRSMTVVSLLSPITSSYDLVSLSAWALPWIPRSLTSLPTKSVPASPSKDKCTMQLEAGDAGGSAMVVTWR